MPIETSAQGRNGGDAVTGILRDAGRYEGSLAVEIAGPSPGVVYLRAGRVMHVDAAGVPDVRTRLVRSAGPVDLRAGGALDDVHRSVLLDGALSVLGPARPEPEVRLYHDVPARLVDRDFPGLDLPEVLEIVAERRARLAGTGVDPDVPLFPKAPESAVVVDAVGWVVAAWLDGRRTARDVAWNAGLEVFATVLAVGRLISEGLCTTARIAPPPEWADDLLAQVDIGQDVILRLIDGIRRLE